MRHAILYKLSTHRPGKGCVLSWYRRLLDAQAALALAKREDGIGSKPASIDRVEIPLTNDGIVDWLNTNCTRGNG
jgi:hypothetical protein